MSAKDDQNPTPAGGEPEPEPQAESRNFMQWLLAQRGGVLHSELTDALQEVVAGAVEHQKPGKLTLTIDVRPMENGVNVMVADGVNAKVPQPDKSPSLFFTDSHGNLSRDNPYQEPLPGLRQLPPRNREAG